jgi:hypothetical protein
MRPSARSSQASCPLSPLFNCHLSYLPILDQPTQRLVPYRPLPKLTLILLHQQITYHTRKHDLSPRIQMRAITPRRAILTPIVCICSLLTNRIHIRR